MTTESFVLSEPQVRSTPVIFASPHSGNAYPADFLEMSVQNPLQLRSSEDAFVDRLFSAAPDHGAPLLAAKLPRAFIDLNRGVNELDPAVIDGMGKAPNNPRVASGLGVIPRVVSNGRPIYNGKIPLAEAHRRISRYWRPYHDRLQLLVDQSRNRFGESILIDCHSMPREALENVPVIRGRRPDVVLGDRFGASASPEVTDYVAQVFADAGFNVARNMPFAGAYVVQTYGRPPRGQHAIQVEIDRSVYMDEDRIEPRDDFDQIHETISNVVKEVALFGAARAQRLAAE